MFISVIKIISTNVSNETYTHAALLQLFNSTRLANDVLYQTLNVDVVDEFIVSHLLVYSKTAPKLPETVPYGFTSVPEIVGCKEVEPKFKKGEVFAFDAVLNPSKKDRESKKRFISNPQDRQAWLERKFKESGAKIGRVSETEKKVVYIGHDYGKGKFVSVHYKGLIMVEDPEAFQKAYQEGIGREKAYGCGLLALTRV